MVAEMHNQLRITKPLPVEASQFYDRPFQIIWGDKFASEIKIQIRDPEVKRIMEFTHIGAVDQFSTSTDMLSDAEICIKLRSIYV
jgi:hypothetical protein